MHDEHFVRSHTLDGYIEEVRESGITKAVVVGRDTPALSIPNERIHEITSAYNELVGVGSVDPQAHGAEQAVAEVERSIKVLGQVGINVEPGFGKPPLKADDPVFFPVYEACAHLGVPVFLMSGPTSPSLEFTDPSAVGRVAAAFPSLSIICYHGFYPYVNEMIGVAFRYDNVYVVPDMYIFLPGGSLYVEAANGFMKDQLLFATSYPFRAMKQTVDDFLRLGWRDNVLESVLHENAERVLKL